MGDLKMPHPFAGLRVERQYGVSEEVISRPVATEIVVCGSLGGHVEQAELFVNRHRGPMPNVARVFPRGIEKVRTLLYPRVRAGRDVPELFVCFEPGVDAELSLLRDRIETPERPTGTSVVGHHVARNVHRPNLIGIADTRAIGPCRYAAGMQ